MTFWLVLSLKHLYFSGCADLGDISEEIQAEWVRSESMGASKAKVDFTVSLQRSASDDGWRQTEKVLSQLEE